MLRICSLFVLALAGFLSSGESRAASLVGEVRVVDGDTLKIAGETVRLYGIDAPEKRQICTDGDGARWECGVWSTRLLEELTVGHQVICDGDERDRYGRLIARCRVGADDLGETMVKRGAAFAYKRYSLDYVDAEKRAFVAAVGIWQGETVLPEAYRAGKRPETQPVNADGCRIKGNISKSGRLYHMPGQRDYDATRIAPSKGERWFCSEAEAQAAGWRRARR